MPHSPRTFLRFALIMALTALLGLLVHELGHGLTAAALGGRFTGLYVWPGVQVWPHPGAPYPREWQGWFGVATYLPGADWQRGGWRFGLVSLMGSGTNFLLAALALGCLWLCRPRGGVRLVLLAEACMFLDLTAYTFFPLLGLRHFLLIGGRIPEPLNGALEMGIPAGVFAALAGAASLAMGWGIGAYLRRAENGREAVDSRP